MDGNKFLDKLFFGSDLIDEWEMITPERVVFQVLVKKLGPAISLEIGSRNGGSLQVLKSYSEKVICIDIDETLPSRLGDRFGDVEFVIGDSREVLPGLLRRLQAEGEIPDFVHIDGDHTSEGARHDLEHILEMKPDRRTVVLMHDTFNPDVRKGIKSIDYNKYENLHYVDLDFMTGVLHSREPVMNEMWGGFALFVLEGKKREGAIEVHNYLEPQFLLTLKGSSHRW